MTNNKLQETVVIIMAGGLGKRMNSDVPKVLHLIVSKPMLVHVLEQAIKLNPLKILVVVGKYRDLIEKTIQQYIDLQQYHSNIIFVNQEEPLGTGHAIQCCKKTLLPFIGTNKTSVLILSGDVPLLSSIMMKHIVSRISDIPSVAITSTIMDEPFGYGRIVKDNSGNFEKIVEEKDCELYEKQIQEINCGIYCFPCIYLYDSIHLLTNNNAQGEYYLTQVIEIMKKQNPELVVQIVEIPKKEQYQILGVNDTEQLQFLESLYLQQIEKV
jgi:UDP-N-acetylglucosamine diphosphorylase/glucosamine-1-phosphate N-acetyltransferase